MNVDINTQPHLGKFFDNYKPQDNTGRLSLAKVIRVHHKSGTADVQIVKNNNTITSSPENEGRFAARILTSAAHFDEHLMTSSGVVEPIMEGQLVAIGYLDNQKRQPIILGSFHNTWQMEMNILTDTYPLDVSNDFDAMREGNKYLRVFPSQLYHRVDGIGAVEWSHPSTTFLKVDPDLDESMSDDHDGFDHADLMEKDPYTNETRTGRTEGSSLPVKLLFTHRSSAQLDEVDEVTWTKFFLDKTGLFRITRDPNDNTTTFMEMNESGGFRVKRQLDSAFHDEGTSTVEMGVTESGGCHMKRSFAGLDISIEISESGEMSLKHHTGSVIQFNNDGDIIINAKRKIVTSEGGE